MQALPGASDTLLAALEANVRGVANTAELVRAGIVGEPLLDLLLEGIGCAERSRAAPRFHCPCSRERALRGAGLMGRETVREIVAAGEWQEVRCEFCGERYDFSPDELGALFPDA